MQRQGGWVWGAEDRGFPPLGSVRAREGSGAVAAGGRAGGEGLLLPGKLRVAPEEDRAAALVLVQQGGVLEVCDQLVLALQPMLLLLLLSTMSLFAKKVNDPSENATDSVR